MSKWKMLAIPRAKQRIMHITPVLERYVRWCRHPCAVREGCAHTIDRIYLSSYVLAIVPEPCSASLLTEVARLEFLGERHDALVLKS